MLRWDSRSESPRHSEVWRLFRHFIHVPLSPCCTHFLSGFYSSSRPALARSWGWGGFSIRFFVRRAVQEVLGSPLIGVVRLGLMVTVLSRPSF